MRGLAEPPRSTGVSAFDAYDDQFHGLGSHPGSAAPVCCAPCCRNDRCDARSTATAAIALALLTWSVQDPSLNHATDAPIHNLLGAPGAITADLLMQMLGLAALALLAPLAIWGWRLLRTRRLDRPGWRLLYWFIGSVAATGFAAVLPVTSRWPLPTGLGGVLGDALLFIPKHIFGGHGADDAHLRDRLRRRRDSRARRRGRQAEARSLFR